MPNVSLGIDLGFRKTGVAVIRENGSSPKIERMFCLVPEKSSSDRKSRQHFEESVRLYRMLSGLITKYQPKKVIVELPTCGAQDSRSMLLMGSSISVLASVCAELEIDVRCVTPGEIKRLVRPKGAVSKDEVKKLVERKFSVKLPKTADSEHMADAAAAYLVRK